MVQAEAMENYIRLVLEPLVSALERSEARVVEQAEIIESLWSENATLRSSQTSPAAQPTPVMKRFSCVGCATLMGR